MCSEVENTLSRAHTVSPMASDSYKELSSLPPPLCQSFCAQLGTLVHVHIHPPQRKSVPSAPFYSLTGVRPVDQHRNTAQMGTKSNQSDGSFRSFHGQALQCRHVQPPVKLHSPLITLTRPAALSILSYFILLSSCLPTHHPQWYPLTLMVGFHVLVMAVDDFFFCLSMGMSRYISVFQCVLVLPVTSCLI